jgi:hypothetical protein
MLYWLGLFVFLAIMGILSRYFRLSDETQLFIGLFVVIIIGNFYSAIRTDRLEGRINTLEYQLSELHKDKRDDRRY